MKHVKLQALVLLYGTCVRKRDSREYWLVAREFAMIVHFAGASQARPDQMLTSPIVQHAEAQQACCVTE